MDITKAFDLVVHSKLLKKLLEASMPAIIVRLLLVMYLTQHANEDVEKMILGNKCDMDDKRQVPTARGETVSYMLKVTIFHLEM